MNLYIDIGKLCKQVEKYLLVIFFLLVFSGIALGTHEADHRYIISGFVRDESGAALKNVVVHLEHKGGEKKKVKTSRSGYYEVLFHLHNENLGDEILIRAGELEKTVKVIFDVEDTASSRGDTVNFGMAAQGVSIWVYLTTASLVVMVVALYFGKGQLKRKKKAMTRQEKRKRKKK